jgi:histone H3/H4
MRVQTVQDAITYTDHAKRKTVSPSRLLAMVGLNVSRS